MRFHSLSIGTWPFSNEFLPNLISVACSENRDSSSTRGYFWVKVLHFIFPPVGRDFFSSSQDRSQLIRHVWRSRRSRRIQEREKKCNRPCSQAASWSYPFYW